MILVKLINACAAAKMPILLQKPVHAGDRNERRGIGNSPRFSSDRARATTYRAKPATVPHTNGSGIKDDGSTRTVKSINAGIASNNVLRCLLEASFHVESRLIINPNGTNKEKKPIQLRACFKVSAVRPGRPARGAGGGPGGGEAPRGAPNKR